jgi:flotillin
MNVSIGFLFGAVGAIVASGVIFWLIQAILSLRSVVSTNDVHIVQRGKVTVSYGKDQTAGNVYYAWPAWLPLLGCTVIRLPMHVFDVDLDGYAAYDKDRVPFVVDVMAFFRVDDTGLAAQRVHTFDELKKQLEGILQGACRSILATSEINDILEGRSTFGEKFTKEVDHNLEAWGVRTVKCIELMDIRDAKDSQVIHNIMAKKKSMIERESRVAVAENIRAAEEAEVIAKREVALRKQEADQQVGQRAAEKDKQVGIATEQAKQEIKAQAKITAERDMEVQRVQNVKQAEIARDVQVVAAEQEKRTQVIKAEGEKQKTVTIAQGSLEQAKLHAEGVRAEGEAKGAADTAIAMAPVNAQTALAKEIGGNAGYQKYLIEIRVVEKDEAIGKANADALKAAKPEIKVIANNVGDGFSGVLDVLSPKGGTVIAGALEALAQSDVGRSMVEKFTKGGK